MSRRVLGVQAAADYLDMSTRRSYHLTPHGKITAKQDGRRARSTRGRNLTGMRLPFQTWNHVRYGDDVLAASQLRATHTRPPREAGGVWLRFARWHGHGSGGGADLRIIGHRPASPDLH